MRKRNEVHRVARRSRQAVTAIAALALVVGGAIALPQAANAVPPTVPSTNFIVGPQAQYGELASETVSVYGASTPAARQLWVSVRTQALKIQSDLFVSNSESPRAFTCSATNAAGASIADPFETPDSTSNTVRLAVRPGAIRLTGTATDTVSCRVHVNEFVAQTLTWVLTKDFRAGAVVTLAETPSKLVSTVVTKNWSGSDKNYPVAVDPGSRIRLYSPAGMWRTAGTPVSLVVLFDGTVPAGNVNVTDDGSILGFDVPVDAAPTATYRLRASATVVVDTGSATTPRLTTVTSWSTTQLEIAG